MNQEYELNETLSEEAITEIEEDFEPGPVRDLWQRMRSEMETQSLADATRLLEDGFEQRRTQAQGALEELSNRLEGTN